MEMRPRENALVIVLALIIALAIIFLIFPGSFGRLILGTFNSFGSGINAVVETLTILTASVAKFIYEAGTIIIKFVTTMVVLVFVVIFYLARRSLKRRHSRR